MWSTAALLHVVGLTVTADGTVVPLAEADKPVYTFDPVCVRCDARGVTEWTPGAASPHPRYLFHVRDIDRYQSAMTAALCALLSELS
jgi:hypothetical protein